MFLTQEMVALFCWNKNSKHISKIKTIWMIYFIKIQWVNSDTFNLLTPNPLLMILVFKIKKMLNWKVLYTSKSDSQRPRTKGPTLPRHYRYSVMMRAECYGALFCNIFSVVIQYVQYVASCVRSCRERSPTHCADQYIISYAHCPIREVLLIPSIRQKT